MGFSSCRACGGRGWKRDSVLFRDKVHCETCQGRGMVAVEHPSKRKVLSADGWDQYYPQPDQADDFEVIEQ